MVLQEYIKNPRLKIRKEKAGLRGKTNIAGPDSGKKPEQKLSRIVEGLEYILGKEQMKGKILLIKMGNGGQ